MDDIGMPTPQTFEDREIDDLENELAQAEQRVGKQKKINQLKQRRAIIEKQSKELLGSTRRFSFGNKSPKFWIIAAVVSIFGAIILFRIIAKFV